MATAQILYPTANADVAGHWAEAWIAQQRAEGLSSGYADGTFRPEAPLTAGELRQRLQGISAD